MRISLFPAALALPLLASPLFAHDPGSDDDWYLQLGIGFVNTTDVDDSPGGTVSFDTGYDFSLALGKHLRDSGSTGMAVELEGILVNFKTDEQDLLSVPSAVSDDGQNMAWLGNLVFDFHASEQFSFYLGGGIGYATDIEYDTFDSGNLRTNDEDGLAYQAKLGFMYHLGGNYDFLFGYRFFATETVEVEDTTTGATFDIDNMQHIIEFGFRWGV